VIVHGAISELVALIDPAAVIELVPCSFSGKCQGILQAPIQLDLTWSRQDPELSEQNPPLDRGEFVALDYGDSLQARISPFR
jgi:hypothetical protein